MKKVLVKFDGIDIGKLGEMDEYKDLAYLPFIKQEDIRKIERFSRRTNKPIINLTKFTEEEKQIMENAIKNEINVIVDFKFHGYWERDNTTVMLTTVKK